MISLEQLSVRNFLSYEFADVRLKDRGLVLCTASAPRPGYDSNGVGKTALFVDAPVWALYGTVIRSKRGGRTLPCWRDDAVIRIGADEAIVIIRIKIDGRSVVVTRRRHRAAGAMLQLHIDNVDHTQSGYLETQSYLENILGLDFESFATSVVFSPTASIGYATSSDARRREMLRAYLHTDIFDEATVSAKALRTRAARDVSDSERRVVEHRTTLAALRDECDRRGVEIDRLRRDLEEYGNDVHRCGKDRDSAAADLSRITKGNAAASDTENLIRDVWDLERRFQSAEANLENRRRDLAKLGKAAAAAAEAVCVTCGQSIPTDEAALAVLTSKLKSAEQAVLELGTACEELNTEYRAACVRLSKAQSVGGMHVDPTAAQERVTRATSALAVAKQRLTDKRNEITAREGALQATRFRCDSEAHRLDEEKKALGTFEQALTDAEFLVSGLRRGVRKIALMRAVSNLNAVVQGFVGGLTSGMATSTYVDATRGDIRVDVSFSDAADRYSAASAGQVRRADIVYALGLQALANGRVGVNYAVYDEFETALDVEGVAAFERLIREESVRKGTVVVITHNRDLADRFGGIDTIVTVGMRDGISIVTSDEEFEEFNDEN